MAASTLALLAPGPTERLGTSPLPPALSPIDPSPGAGGETLFFSRSSRIERGVVYRFTLSTHCGLNGLVDFDGSLWDFGGPGPSDDGRRNPPEGFGNPEDFGTIKLISSEKAEYRSQFDKVAVYERRSEPKPLPPCY